jgi:hypothetical protein
METKRRTPDLQNVPNPQEDINGGDDSSIIHVPLLVHGVERRNLINKRGKGETKVERT